MTLYRQELNTPKPPHLGAGNWELKNLTDITVLFGKNGSGKSQLLRGIRTENLNGFHYIPPQRAGNIANNQNFAIAQFDPAKRSNTRDSNIAEHFHSEAVSRIQTVMTKLGSHRDGSINPDDTYKKIEQFMQALLPGFQFNIIDAPLYHSLNRVSDGKPVGNVAHLSSGEAALFGLALDLLTICTMWQLEAQPERILLMDEPDTHLHPDLQQHLGQFLIKLINEYQIQIIMATHSTTLLSALGYHGGEKTSVIYLNHASPRQTTNPFDEKLQELSSCLGGHILMGPLFGAPLILVEGDDDYKIWSHIPRYHRIKLATIPCKGATEVKKFQQTLENLFGSLCSATSKPIGYALLDGDQTLPSVDDLKYPQKYIKFLKLSCHESENLFLSLEVLGFLQFQSWDEAKLRIKSQSSNYPSKKSILDNCDKWDRKKGNEVKQVIYELSEILDAKKVSWTIRVAQCIGKGIPTGELADFLGQEVISSIWQS